MGVAGVTVEAVLAFEALVGVVGVLESASDLTSVGEISPVLPPAHAQKWRDVFSGTRYCTVTGQRMRNEARKLTEC